jgi:hypothetical protein
MSFLLGGNILVEPCAMFDAHCVQFRREEVQVGIIFSDIWHSTVWRTLNKASNKFLVVCGFYVSKEI